MPSLDRATRAELKAAYKAAARPMLHSNVDVDVAADRFNAKHCKHTAADSCALEHAWWDGWAYEYDSKPPFLADGPKGDVFKTNFDGEDTPAGRWEKVSD